MNRFKRDYLAAYISASSDPATYGKITVLTIPGQVNGPKLANNAITTDTAVSQDLGVIGRDNQNRIRWGNLLTLPVAQGGLLYVEPVYASPGASDAASSYPRLIRVAMMYNDKIGYGPPWVTRSPGCSGPVPVRPRPVSRPPSRAVPPASAPPRPAAGQRRPPAANHRRCRVAVPPAPSGRSRLSPAKSAALQGRPRRQSALPRRAKDGDFAAYGAGAAAARRRDQQVYRQHQIIALAAAARRHMRDGRSD